MLAQLERAFDRGDTLHRVCGKVAKETTRNLHEGKRFDNEEGKRPVPEAPRSEPDRSEEACKEIECRRKPGRRPDPVEHANVVLGVRADKLPNVLTTLFGIGLCGFGFGIFERVYAEVGHDTSVPSITVRRRSARVITPVSLPSS